MTKIELPQEIKTKIDQMSYEQMLRLNRYAPVGEPLFQGVTGTYFFENMSKKKDELPLGEHVRISKLIGWDGNNGK